MSGGGNGYGGGAGDDDDMISGINVTPLVDVTLVLLIIFMVTARFIVNKAIAVKSPRAVSGEEVKTTLELGIDAKRTLYLNRDPVADRQVVADYVRRAVAQNPDIQAVITADEAVPHGDVIGLIDTVKLAGVRNFALTVDNKEKPR